MKSHLLDVYSTWLHVATSEKQWDVLSEKKKLDLSSPHGVLAMTQQAPLDKPGGVQVFHIAIYLNQKALKSRSNALLVETCAHEATHAAGMILDFIGHEYGGHDEPVAYLVGWITQWLYKSVRKV